MSTSEWALIITACLSGLATIITAYAGFVKSKHEVKDEAEAECQAKLKEARMEAEQLAEDLHRLRMQRDA